MGRLLGRLLPAALGKWWLQALWLEEEGVCVCAFAHTGVLQEPSWRPTMDLQLKTEGGRRLKQWRQLKRGKEGNKGGCLASFSALALTFPWI